MNTESINYRSIVNKYMHDDRTLIFSLIATLHLDSSNLPTTASTHIHNPNPLTWGFDYPQVLKIMSKVSLQNVQDISQIEIL